MRLTKAAVRKTRCGAVVGRTFHIEGRRGGGRQRGGPGGCGLGASWRPGGARRGERLKTKSIGAPFRHSATADGEVHLYRCAISPYSSPLRHRLRKICRA